MTVAKDVKRELLKPYTTEQTAAAEEARKYREQEVHDREMARRWSVWQGVIRAVGIRYERATIEEFEFHGSADERDRQRTALDAVTAYRNDIGARVKRGEGVIFHGPVGSGKDHLMVALMREACRAGFSVVWKNGVNLFAEMRDRIDSDITERQIVLDLVAPDILGISDVLPPSGPLTPYQAQTVMQIVDARYRQKRSTWCTLNVETGAQAAERMGLAVVDRLREGALVVNFDWESYRTRKQY